MERKRIYIKPVNFIYEFSTNESILQASASASGGVTSSYKGNASGSNVTSGDAKAGGGLWDNE